MIDPPLSSVVPPVAAAREPQGLARLPVPAGLGRLLVLGAVFVCAACGLIYELELVALASYLTGDSVTQASVVLSVMVFAMGIGSLLAKRLRWRPAVGFGLVEAALALIGGTSAMALYAAFAWFGPSRSVLVAFSCAIGVLIGAEVPLLMTLIQRIRRQDAGGAVADLFAADYVGALVGGLAFPFLLLPELGQLSGALLTGAVNAVAGGAMVLWLFRRDLTLRARWLLLGANVLVLALLAACTLLAQPFERAARRAVYGTDVRVAVRTDVQEVVLTGGVGGPAGRPPAVLSLFVDGRLRVGGRDGARDHEALVHPAMAASPRRVLILGGGDGLALREVLQHPRVTAVTLVEPDAELVRLARTDPGLSRLNGDAFGDRRLRVVVADAFDWLRKAARSAERPYDVVVCDLPDPATTGGARLYSAEFYGLVRRVLAPDGRLAVHTGRMPLRRRAFWTVDATLRSAGLRTVPYRVAATDRPDGTGLFLAARRESPARLELSTAVPGRRSPARLSLRAVARERVRGLPASTLMHPRYID
ncbi:polyamine aminopropyltransferase [Streptomyces sp. KR80]|uniref:polyamine aminopropyltransferase n=1 Tax=Streptomyces sp. KR80 TaxID=3457426 RepID=UPI003FCF8C39